MIKKLCALFLSILLLFAVGCSNGDENAAKDDVQKINETEGEPLGVEPKDEKEQLFVDFFAAWNKGDKNAMDAMVFYGYGDMDIAGDITTVKSIVLQTIEPDGSTENSDTGEVAYTLTFTADFTDGGASCELKNGENRAKVTLLFDDEVKTWLISAWEKIE